MNAIVFIGRQFFRLAFGLFLRVRLSGTENIPEDGPLIVASNHVTALDMVFLEYKIKRRILWMAKAELFKNKFVGWLLRKLGAFPVHRGAVDVSAAKTVLDLLEEGKTVGIFPQGTRSKDPDNPLKARYGIARFAVESGVPVLPVSIFGNFRIFGRVYVHYGKPVLLEKKEDGTAYTKAEYTELAQNLMDGIYATIREMRNGSEAPNGNYKG